MSVPTFEVDEIERPFKVFVTITRNFFPLSDIVVLMSEYEEEFEPTFDQVLPSVEVCHWYDLVPVPITPTEKDVPLPATTLLSVG